MILFFNVRMTKDLSAHNLVNRGHLAQFDNMDIFKYTLASYEPLNHLWKKVIIYCRIEPEYMDRKQELHDWIYSVFPERLVSLHWNRLDCVDDFRQATTELHGIDSTLIWFQGNHDHPFLDSDTTTIEKGIDLMLENKDPMASLWYSHHPEELHSAVRFGQPTADGKYYQSNMSIENFHVSVKIVKKRQWMWYWFDNYRPHVLTRNNLPMDCKDERLNSIQVNDYDFRFEYMGWNNQCWSCFVPIKEQARHFDGYMNINLGKTSYPPLEIPKGFFDHNIKIKYGFDQRDNEYVNVNPLATSFLIDTPLGHDYVLGLDELPLFWKKYTAEVIINDNLDPEAVRQARNNGIINRTNITFPDGRATRVPIDLLMWRFR